MKSVCLPKEMGWEKPNTPGMEGPDLGEISPFLQVPPAMGSTLGLMAMAGWDRDTLSHPEELPWGTEHCQTGGI